MERRVLEFWVGWTKRVEHSVVLTYGVESGPMFAAPVRTSQLVFHGFVHFVL